MISILVTEDDSRVAAFIKKGLEENMNQVTVVPTGKAAVDEATINDYDLIILDIMLPDIDGFEVCSILRRRQNTTHIIMLSALDTPEEKVKGLQCGADDYLSKPFVFEELVARINALRRRVEYSNGIVDYYRYAGVEINIEQQSVTRDGKELILTPREFNLLVFLMRNREKVLSRITIAQSVWDIHFDTTSNYVDVYINYLRNKLDKGFSQPLIHTIKGRGYMLKQKANESET
ncbi:response regulator transcription factor [Spirosoma terrae]|uniref:Response regulator transcription factor n=1 Tax=Spirosoma terrae TaxID=1968276 RepID=A0A6L9L391_9BACT|nr:response regulator transcription factor [Spirosoma terrae]NDU95085.1 response regulator transcription factor [Spirosoma terrae]